MIRKAAFVDIPRIAELMTALHASSIYATRCGIDIAETKALFMRLMQRHGGKNDGSALVFVAEKDGVVEGFIAGILTRVYHVGDKLVAQDVFLHLTEKADKPDLNRLVSAYLDWANDCPKVVEINLSATDVIGSTARVEKLYRRKGFIQCGAIYRKAVTP